MAVKQRTAVLTGALSVIARAAVVLAVGIILAAGMILTAGVVLTTGMILTTVVHLQRPPFPQNGFSRIGKIVPTERA